MAAALPLDRSPGAAGPADLVYPPTLVDASLQAGGSDITRLTFRALGVALG